MKRIDYFAVFIASVFIIAMTSCGPSFGKDLDYRKACEEKDFVKAYEIVDILKEEINYAKTTSWYGDLNREPHVRAAREKAAEAEKYVVLQESMMLLENGDDSSLMRIVAVAKEHNADRWLYDELIDVATKISRNDLAEKLKKMKYGY